MTKEQPCLYLGKHTRAPKNYPAWHAWADKMKETHVQTQCPGCNLWVIWVPKEGASDDATEEGREGQGPVDRVDAL